MNFARWSNTGLEVNEYSRRCKQCEQNLADTTSDIKRPLGLHLSILKIRDKMENLGKELKTINE